MANRQFDAGGESGGEGKKIKKSDTMNDVEQNIQRVIDNCHAGFRGISR